MKLRLFVGLFLFLFLNVNAQISVIENGDVGVKIENPEHELDIEGVTRTSEYFEGVLANKAEIPNTFQRIMFPEGATLFHDEVGGGGGGSGAIKIVLPLDWNSTMMKFSVEVFSYRYDQSFSLEIAGYPYAGGGGYWTQTSAAIVGGKEHPQMAVRFAHDGNRPCVIIGETNTQWAYLNVVVSDLYVRLLTNTTLEDWTKGWSMERITSLPSNIDREHYVSSAYQTLSSFDYGVNTIRETSKFYFWLNNHPENSSITIGKLHLPGYVTYSFDVTVAGYFGTITYRFSGYSTNMSKNIISATPKQAGILIDELVDVQIQYNTNPNEAVIQIVNNSTTAQNYIENVIVESHAQLIAPYFTTLDHNTTITPVNYAVDQNSARGKWENSNQQAVNDLDQTISRNGDVFINSTTSGIILKDQSNGNCYRIISQNGVLNTQVVTCPQ